MASYNRKRKNPLLEKNESNRREFVRNLMQERFNFKAEHVLPQHNPQDPNKFSRFSYYISGKPLSVNGSKRTALQHGCEPLPVHPKKFTLLLNNPDTDQIHHEPSIENEVAMMSLIRHALSVFPPPSVVPKVYAWENEGSPESGHGWILKELRPAWEHRVPFRKLKDDEKDKAMVQMVKMLEVFQNYRLPRGIECFGSVRFGPSGKIVSATRTNNRRGPWASYEEYYSDRLKAALEKADANLFCDGWKENDLKLRPRLNDVVKNGFTDQFAVVSEKNTKVIIHGRFSKYTQAFPPSVRGVKLIFAIMAAVDNMWFNSRTGEITDISSYDSACIHHPSFEFLRSFNGGYGQFPFWHWDCTEHQGMPHFLALHGYPTSFPPLTADDDKRRPRERFTWEKHILDQCRSGQKVETSVVRPKRDSGDLTGQNVMRPTTMEGLAYIAAVDAVLREILPTEHIGKGIMDDATRKAKSECVQRLDILLRDVEDDQDAPVSHAIVPKHKPLRQYLGPRLNHFLHRRS